MNEECECSEEYGPCEDHCEILAQREGASARTADDLVYVFLTDVLAILEHEWRERVNAPGADLFSDETVRMGQSLDKIRDAETFWSEDSRWDDNYGCRWVREDEPEISDEITTGESVLADLGLTVWWEDGYVISRTIGGPLLED